MVHTGIATLNVTSCSNKNEQHDVRVRDNLVRNCDRGITQAQIK